MRIFIAFVLATECPYLATRAPPVRAVQGDPEQRAGLEAGAQVPRVLLVAPLLRQRLLQGAGRDPGQVHHVILCQQVM